MDHYPNKQVEIKRFNYFSFSITNIGTYGKKENTEPLDS